MYVFLCSGGRHIFMHNALWLPLVPKQVELQLGSKTTSGVFKFKYSTNPTDAASSSQTQLEVISAHPIGIAGSPWYRNSAWWMTPLELVRGSSNVSVWDPTVPPWYQRPSECAADIPRWLHPDLAWHSKTALLAAASRNPSYKPMMMERPNLMGWLQWKNASSLS